MKEDLTKNHSALNTAVRSPKFTNKVRRLALDLQTEHKTPHRRHHHEY